MCSCKRKKKDEKTPVAKLETLSSLHQQIPLNNIQDN